MRVSFWLLSFILIFTTACQPTVVPVQEISQNQSTNPSVESTSTLTETASTEPTITSNTESATNTDTNSAAGSEIDAENGRNLYNAQCLHCHGDAEGNNAVLGGALTSGQCLTCADKPNLVSEIQSTMPLGNTDACNSDCSQKIADYILLTFSGYDKQHNTTNTSTTATNGTDTTDNIDSTNPSKPTDSGTESNQPTSTSTSTESIGSSDSVLAGKPLRDTVFSLSWQRTRGGSSIRRSHL